MGSAFLSWVKGRHVGFIDFVLETIHNTPWRQCTTEQQSIKTMQNSNPSRHCRTAIHQDTVTVTATRPTEKAIAIAIAVSSTKENILMQDVCPICLERSDVYISLSCNDSGVGHDACLECFQTILASTAADLNVKCPQCRATYPHSELLETLSYAQSSKRTTVVLREPTLRKRRASPELVFIIWVDEQLNRGRTIDVTREHLAHFDIDYLFSSLDRYLSVLAHYCPIGVRKRTSVYVLMDTISQLINERTSQSRRLVTI